MRQTVLNILTPVILLLLCVTEALGASYDEVEYKLKAAYMLNFAKFMSWPSSMEDASGFPICVSGENPFGSALAGLEKKSIKGQAVILKHSNSIESITDCRIVFVSRSESGRLKQIIEQVAAKPVVLISDIEGFAAQGGTVEFVFLGDKLRFIINNSKARESGIRITASLLKLAIEVL